NAQISASDRMLQSAFDLSEGGLGTIIKLLRSIATVATVGGFLGGKDGRAALNTHDRETDGFRTTAAIKAAPMDYNIPMSGFVPASVKLASTLRADLLDVIDNGFKSRMERIDNRPIQVSVDLDGRRVGEGVVNNASRNSRG
ncbi:MAG: hypothetical protein KY428_12990, partial [Bacteroidetes bacterium]|nr:hypothetical protein [Bacteroidota bacterium]